MQCSLLLSGAALVLGLGGGVEVVHGSLALCDASQDGALEGLAFDAVWIESTPFFVELCMRWITILSWNLAVIFLWNLSK